MWLRGELVWNDGGAVSVSVGMPADKEVNRGAEVPDEGAVATDSCAVAAAEGAAALGSGPAGAGRGASGVSGSGAMGVGAAGGAVAAAAVSGASDAPAPDPLREPVPAELRVPVAGTRERAAAEARGQRRLAALRRAEGFDRERPGYRFVKRTFDICFSAAAIAVALVPSALLCAAIAIESPGCPIYRQRRVGRIGADGRPREFTMWKFRSMCKGAEAMKDGLMASNEVSGPMFKMRDDPRVTRVGRFIRRHSIDEFPQFVNVLLGDMSVVGPRPPLPCEVAEYDAWAMQRLAVKPGLTGPWQVGGRSDVDFDDMVRLDLGYIARRSVSMDLKIIIKTIAAVFTGKGAA